MLSLRKCKEKMKIYEDVGYELRETRTIINFKNFVVIVSFHVSMNMSLVVLEVVQSEDARLSTVLHLPNTKPIDLKRGDC